MPEAVAALRNLISLGRVLAAFDPDLVDRLAREVSGAVRPSQERGRRPPSLWRIFRTAFSEDGRRGMAFAAGFLVGLGRAVTKS
jgi:hypothetical protein